MINRVRRFLILGLIVLALMVMAISVLTVRNLDLLSQARHQGTEVSDLMRRLDAIEIDTRGAEISLSEYLATGKDSYKDILSATLTRISVSLPVLEQTGAGVLGAERIQDIAARLRREVEELRAIAELTSDEQAQALYSSHVAQGHMQELAEDLKPLEQEAERLFVQRRLNSDERYKMARIEAVATGCCGLLALGLFAVFGRRRFAEYDAGTARVLADRDKIETTLKSISDAVITTDVEGRIEFMNQRAEALTGLPQELAIGKDVEQVFNIVDSDRRTPLASPVRTALAMRRVVAGENRTLLVSSHTEHLVESIASPITSGRDDLRGVVLTFRDNTKKAANEAALREAHERLRLALDAGVIIGTWIWDLQTDRCAMDAALATAYSVSTGPASFGLPWEVYANAIVESDREGVRRKLSEAIESGAMYRAEYRIDRSPEPLWVESSGLVEFDEDARPLRFPGVVVDISERKRIERELLITQQRARAELLSANNSLEARVLERTRELEEQIQRREQVEEELRQLQKMEAVGQLTGGLAHDFNNFLGGISGSLELASMRLVEGRPDEVQRHLESASAAAMRAAKLTHRLLAFSRRQTLEPRQIKVDQLVESMLDLIRRTMGEAVQVHWECREDIWPVRSDANQLESALLNVAINARDAMPDGGVLTIRIENRLIDTAYAFAHPGSGTGEHVCIEVMDTGTGMTSEIRDRAFDPFFTTKPMGEGTGLGLSMVYGFVKQSGGYITIDSTPDRGTAITFLLPRDLSVAVPAPLPGEEVKTPPAPISGKSILVVDDDATIRSVLVEVLIDVGYEVLEAEKAETALEIIRKRDSLDVLLTDVGLPGGINGRQLADAALELLVNLRVIFITGYAEQSVMKDQDLPGNMRVLVKPFKIDRVLSTIESVLGEDRTAVSPLMAASG